MALALFQQQVDDIDVELQRPGQLDTIRRGSSGRRLADPQRHALTHRDDLRHRRFAVEHGNRLTVSDRPEVLAQAGLEFGYPNGFHPSIMTRNSHKANAVAPLLSNSRDDMPIVNVKYLARVGLRRFVNGYA